MKYLYILISTSADTYYEQTLFSILTLRECMPDAYITLLTDTVTEENLNEDRSQIRKYINEFITIPLDRNDSGMRRSRWLKTSMRNIVDGDFLFIDSDTIVISALEILDNFDGDIGAVQNHHSNQGNYYGKYLLKKLNFAPYKDNHYFNSGVLFVRDTELARAFFKRWHELWQYCITKKIFVDQASFAQTDFEFGYIIQEMPGEWNCQIFDGINFFSNAKIMHTFTSYTIESERNIHPIMNNNFYKKMKEEQNLSKLANETIISFKNSFVEGTKIISPEYDKMLNTEIFFVFKKVYTIAPFLFKVINFPYWLILTVIRYFRRIYKNTKGFSKA